MCIKVLEKTLSIRYAEKQNKDVHRLPIAMPDWNTKSIKSGKEAISMGKILITESVHAVGPDILSKAGHQVVYADRDMDVIRREIVDADALFVRIIELPQSLLETGKNLKIVSKHGVGVDNIDLEYCRKAGIAVTITPDANGLSVAEHAFALMMSLSKKIIPVSKAYKEIGFTAKNTPPCMEISGKTAGVVGLGKIGTHFAKMCLYGFGMEVLAYDPFVKEAPEGITLVSDLNELLCRSDIVSLHCSLVDGTRKIINQERLAVMKSSALLINCARGPLVDEAALISALQSGKLAGAGLDVTDPEPISPDSPLFQMDNVIVTPHYAPTTLEAAMRVSKIAAENIVSYLSGRAPVGRLI